MFWRGIHKFSNIQVAPGGQSIGFGNYNTKGRTYFVNNITGHSNRDGLSWGKAFAEVSQAITASEAFRKEAATNNENIRNTIVVQGTGKVYAALTELPSYCDIIGLGAPANGNGAGIVRIGADGADGIAGTARGLGLYNLQVISGGDFYCMDFVNLFRSTIQDCALFAASDGMTGGMRFSSSSGGNKIRGNHWGSVVAHSQFLTGIQVDGPSFDHNEIEDNYIQGQTAGIKVESTVTQGGWTIVRNNVIGDIAGEGCVLGVDDNAPVASEWGNTHIIYANNIIIASTIATLIDGADTYWVGNVIAHAMAAATAS